MCVVKWGKKETLKNFNKNKPVLMIIIIIVFIYYVMLKLLANSFIFFL